MANKYNRQQGQLGPKGDKFTNKRIVVSYIYLDRAQGQNFEQWDLTPGRLLRLENIIQHLNTLTVEQALHSGVVTKYLNIPVNIHNMPIRSRWKYPQHIENKEVVWCKIVVMQLVRIIGFFEENVFYVVFLDENHEFYPTEPQ